MRTKKQQEMPCIPNKSESLDNMHTAKSGRGEERIPEALILWDLSSKERHLDRKTSIFQHCWGLA
jgi:hypothetical protein